MAQLALGATYVRQYVTYEHKSVTADRSDESGPKVCSGRAVLKREGKSWEIREKECYTDANHT